MTVKEKIELNKDAIEYLYCKRGESISSISSNIKVNRKELSKAIKEWGFIQKKTYKMSPKIRKFISQNKDFIISRMNECMSDAEIAKLLNVSVDFLRYTYKVNEELRISSRNRTLKKRAKASEFIKEKQKPHKFEELNGEEWKEILGYSGYYVSNMGRVKHRLVKTKDYKLLSPSPNVRNGRMYVSIVNDNGQRKNVNLARLVGHNFVDGYSEENNTIDHIDNNVQNNKSINLQWVSQSDNNKNAYIRGRKVNKVNHKAKRKIVIDDKYEFSTVSSASRFIGISETQFKRYLDSECECKSHKVTQVY